MAKMFQILENVVTCSRKLRLALNIVIVVVVVIIYKDQIQKMKTGGGKMRWKEFNQEEHIVRNENEIL